MRTTSLADDAVRFFRNAVTGEKEWNTADDSNDGRQGTGIASGIATPSAERVVVNRQWDDGVRSATSNANGTNSDTIPDAFGKPWLPTSSTETDMTTTTANDLPDSSQASEYDPLGDPVRTMMRNIFTPPGSSPAIGLPLNHAEIVSVSGSEPRNSSLPDGTNTASAIGSSIPTFDTNSTMMSGNFPRILIPEFQPIPKLLPEMEPHSDKELQPIPKIQPDAVPLTGDGVKSKTETGTETDSGHTAARPVTVPDIGGWADATASLPSNVEIRDGHVRLIPAEMKESSPLGTHDASRILEPDSGRVVWSNGSDPLPDDVEWIDGRVRLRPKR